MLELDLRRGEVLQLLFRNAKHLLVDDALDLNSI
jgi:hypothetical protein